MEIHFKIAGVLLVALSVIHVGFPRRFNWKQELSGLSLLNRQMMYVHTFFIGLVVLLMGVLCFCCAEELTRTEFGRKISLGFGIFWLARLFVQFFGYSTKLWKGKLFETFVHILFSITWVWFSWLFLATYFCRVGEA
jgi:hypothetical protein